MQLLGHEIKGKASKEKELPSIVPKDDQDGAFLIISNDAFQNTLANFEGAFKDENTQIARIRNISEYPEVAEAVDIIADEAVNLDDKNVLPVTINLDKSELSESLKNKIVEEFDEVLNLLHFSKLGNDIFKQWYIDGKIYFHKMWDENNLKQGIKELRWIDPKSIKKIRDIKKEVVNGVEIVKTSEDYFLFDNSNTSTALFGFQNYTTFGNLSNDRVKIATDHIAYASSGLYDSEKRSITSYLTRCIKVANQYRMIEDAIVIYRLTRAPERRLFYIDVTGLPKPKAEKYIKDLISKYRNRESYDPTTGQVTTTRDHLSMVEDFWLPRREGQSSTEVSTLPGGQNLGEIEDLLFFRKKLYRSLKIPPSRFEDNQPFNVGRSSEITRDEVAFAKFVTKLRMRFSILFEDLLGTQLILKNIMTKDEWKAEKNNIIFDFIEDNYSSELKELEILTSRLEMLDRIDTHKTYFSDDFIVKNILKFTEEEWKEINKQKKKEQQEKEQLEKKGLGFDDENEDESKKSSPFDKMKTPEKADTENKPIEKKEGGPNNE